MPTSRSKRIAIALRRHARDCMDWSRWAETPGRMTHSKANLFLLGVMFDQGIPWQRAWAASRLVGEAFRNDAEPDSVWERIADTPVSTMQKFMRYGFAGSAMHRYWRRYAAWLPDSAQIVVEKYNGDPRRIWHRQRSVAKVKDRLRELSPVGEALATMAVLLLAREHGLLGGRRAAKQLDVKVDIHLRRVFRRTGLASVTATDADVIRAARDLAPDFPASLDPPAFDIGQGWCHKSRPNCSECPLRSVCPKLNT